MSDKDLTTFERRFEDWRVDHPWQWIATTDRTTAAKFISDQTEKIRRTQLEAADRIIVGQERIASGIDEIAVGVDRVARGLEGLASAFEWGLSEIVWHLEQERKRSKKKEDATTTEYYLKELIFWSGQPRVPQGHIVIDFFGEFIPAEAEARNDSKNRDALHEIRN